MKLGAGVALEELICSIFWIIVGGFDAAQLDGNTVTGKPLSSQDVLRPTGTVAVIRKPCWSYDVTML